MQLRLEDPRKKWKYDIADKIESKNRDAYSQVYERIFEKCSPKIPWEVVPADQKWYRNMVIANKVVNALEDLNMKYPD